MGKRRKAESSSLLIRLQKLRLNKRFVNNQMDNIQMANNQLPGFIERDIPNSFQLFYGEDRTLIPGQYTILQRTGITATIVTLYFRSINPQRQERFVIMGDTPRLHRRIPQADEPQYHDLEILDPPDADFPNERVVWTLRFQSLEDLVSAEEFFGIDLDTNIFSASEGESSSTSTSPSSDSSNESNGTNSSTGNSGTSTRRSPERES